MIFDIFDQMWLRRMCPRLRPFVLLHLLNWLVSESLRTNNNNNWCFISFSGLQFRNHYNDIFVYVWANNKKKDHCDNNNKKDGKNIQCIYALSLSWVNVIMEIMTCNGKIVQTKKDNQTKKIKEKNEMKWRLSWLIVR